MRQLATAAWRASAEERESRCHGGRGCPTRHVPYGDEDSGTDRADPACTATGCLDVFHELLTRMMGKMLRYRSRAPQTRIVNPEAYARTVAKTELVEMLRARRLSAGFPAKPARLDGPVGRISEALAAQGGAEGEWLVALLRIMLSYPHSQSMIPGRWPVEGMLVERATYLPCGGLDEVHRDIATVMTTARRHGGDGWAYEHLVLPLKSCGPTAELPELRAETPDSDDLILGRWLRRIYFRRRAAGSEPEAALSSACREVTGREAPRLCGEVAEAVRELEEELAEAIRDARVCA